MSRFIPRGAVALPALLIALGTSAAVAVPAQAAGSWSPPVQLPGSCGGSVAVNAAGAQAAAGYQQNPDNSITVQACTSVDGQTWSGPVTLARGVSPAVAIARGGPAVAAWGGVVVTPAIVQATVQATVRPPGGQWRTAAILSTDAFCGPVIGIAGSGTATPPSPAITAPINTPSLT